MKERYITEKSIREYARKLSEEEKSPATVERYTRALRKLMADLPDGGRLTKEALIAWKREQAESLAAGTVNTMLAAVNGYLESIGLPALRLRPLKVQRKIFRDKDRELSRSEYLRLIEQARSDGNERLALIMETLGSTGIRISELRSITKEAAKDGQAQVDCKGKRRIVLIPKGLRKQLCAYCKRQGISSGPVFVTGSGRPVDRSNIWHEMKRLCERAGVEASKVFPHNFRHLFAVIYYRICRDISKLADLLGHASIATTRIYLMEPQAAHERQIERLGLVV